MPKIIENIHARLIEELERMIQTEGEEITIRGLAKRTGIAVGTVYNYFPDKDDLLKALFQREWSQTIAMIEDQLNRTELTQDEQIGQIVSVMYDTFERIKKIKERKRNLFGHGKRPPSPLPPFPHRSEGWQWLCDAFRPVWQRIFSYPPADMDRLTIALVSMLPRLIHLFPGEREHNVYFITQIIKGCQLTYGKSIS